MIKRLIAILIFLPLLVSSAWGATYYIDNTLTDTNVASATPDCTTYNPTTYECGTGAASAFARLADTKTFSAGDYVLLRKGLTYAENWTLRSSGSAGNYVTYGAFGSGANPIVGGRIRIRKAYTAGGHYTILQDMDIVNSSDRGIELGGFDHIIIRRINITGSVGYGIEVRAETADYSDDVLIEDVNISNGSNYGIRATFGNDGVIRRVRAWNNGTVHNNISASPSGTATLLIEDSTAYNAAGGNGFGTSVSNTDQTVIFRRCKSYGNPAGGFIGHGTVAGTVRYEYCISHNNGTYGIAIGDDSSSNAPVGVVYNCTITANTGNGLVLNTTGATTIRNNIVWGNGTYEITHKTSTMTSDYNLIDSSGTNPVANLGTGTTWAAWLALGYDAHSLTSNPKLKSSTDFHLLPGSPCINKGTPVGLTSDFAGRPVGALPDIGAYEYFTSGGGGGFGGYNFNFSY